MRKTLKMSAVLLILLVAGAGMIWAAGQGEAGKATPAGERPVIDFYHMIGGVANPAEDFDPNNNPVVNWVNDHVGVKLQLRGPQTSENMPTEVNLLLASGDLPDMMHSGWLYPAVDKAATEGAFIELKPYWEKSPIVQKHCTEQMLAMCKAPDGKNYRIPVDQRRGWKLYYNIVRKDLIDEVYGGKMPTTMDQWTELFRAVKKKYPKATPLTSWNLPAAPWWSTCTIFQFFGVNPWEWHVRDGRVVADFETPAYREAVKYYRQMFKEGIMDNEFATQPRNKMEAKFTNDVDKAMLRHGRVYWVIGKCVPDPKKKDDPNIKMQWVYAPPLTEAPPGVTRIEYTYSTSASPIYGNGTYISSQTKDKDLVWRVIEAFASDEVQNMHDWGIEGIQYVVKNGERVITDSFMKKPHANWNIFGFITGYDDATAKEQIYKKRNPEAYKRFKASMQAHEGYYQKRGVNIGGFLSATDEIAKKKGEALEFLNNATAKAITGDISMEEFDQMVAQFKQKFGFIDEEYTKQLKENKDKWLTAGCLEAGW